MTEREKTVLRYLATMLSNAEIAEEMFLSPNTVKVHLRHVYRKLTSPAGAPPCGGGANYGCSRTTTAPEPGGT